MWSQEGLLSFILWISIIRKEEKNRKYVTCFIEKILKTKMHWTIKEIILFKLLQYEIYSISKIRVCG